MGSRMGLIGWLVIVVAILLLRGVTTTATVYKVGGSLGWTVPPNTTFYNTWATTNLQTFKLDVDKLAFNTTETHDVTQVSKADYDNCTENISTQVIVKPESLFTLGPFGPGTAGLHYLICTVDDHCERGQKFSFNVIGSAQSPTSSASSLSVGALFAVFIIIYLSCCFSA